MIRGTSSRTTPRSILAVTTKAEGERLQMQRGNHRKGARTKGSFDSNTAEWAKVGVALLVQMDRRTLHEHPITLRIITLDKIENDRLVVRATLRRCNNRHRAHTRLSKGRRVIHRNKGRRVIHQNNNKRHLVTPQSKDRILPNNSHHHNSNRRQVTHPSKDHPDGQIHRTTHENNNLRRQGTRQNKHQGLRIIHQSKALLAIHRNHKQGHPTTHQSKARQVIHQSKEHQDIHRTRDHRMERTKYRDINKVKAVVVIREVILVHRTSSSRILTTREGGNKGIHRHIKAIPVTYPTGAHPMVIQTTHRVEAVRLSKSARILHNMGKPTTPPDPTTPAMEDHKFAKVQVSISLLMKLSLWVVSIQGHSMVANGRTMIR
mmetsp:Transcript_12899/g.20867  ORF Transcript_12899/g.20867 Transcript_12899/m.20867 type:complete len:375 (-) Transcript_12899:839-1963(-)